MPDAANDPAMHELDAPHWTCSWHPPPPPPGPWEDAIDGDDLRDSVMT